MSRRFCSALIATALGLFLASCNNASPEKYFDEAVLNVNLITPFGGQAALYSLAHPSVKLVPGTKDQTTPMSRKEIVEDQIQRVEANLAKIKSLPDSEETRDMVQTSIKLHEFVLPIKRLYIMLGTLARMNASCGVCKPYQRVIEEVRETWPQFWNDEGNPKCLHLAALTKLDGRLCFLYDDLIDAKLPLLRYPGQGRAELPLVGERCRQRLVSVW